MLKNTKVKMKKGLSGKFKKAQGESENLKRRQLKRSV